MSIWAPGWDDESWPDFSLSRDDEPVCIHIAHIACLSVHRGQEGDDLHCLAQACPTQHIEMYSALSSIAQNGLLKGMLGEQYR